jgi:hypothetical protein
MNVLKHDSKILKFWTLEWISEKNRKFTSLHFAMCGKLTSASDFFLFFSTINQYFSLSLFYKSNKIEISKIPGDRKEKQFWIKVLRSLEN